MCFKQSSSCCFGPQGILWLHLSGIVWSFCLSSSGLRGYSGSNCQGLSGLSVCQFQASKDNLAPAVGDCLVFLFVNFGPRGILWLQLSRIIWFFCVSVSGLRGYSGASSRGLFGRSSCRFRASGGTLAPGVGDCLVFLSINFGPQGILLLQLSGIVLSGFSVCQFRASGDTVFSPQQPGSVWSFCL